MRHPTTEGRRTKRAGWLAGASMIALAAPVLVATPATAIEFNFGDVSGSFDTTFTYGLSFRVADRDNGLIGIANGGTRFSVNADDGNLNYDTGLISNALRGTHEVLIDYKGFGVFSRATYFYDFENANGDNTEFKNLPDDSIQRVGKDFNLLDAYVYGGFDIADVAVDFRIGDQVLSWGESTFIQNGINVINPIDVNAIRIPGSEIRDALLPVTIADVDVSLTDNFSVEGFYQIDWEETDIDASGTYFSTNDFASPGGSILFLDGRVAEATATAGLAAPNNLSTVLPPPVPAPPFIGAAVPRGATDEPSDSGQFGFAARYYAEQLGGTEFGLYYLNYHSRTPIISARVGTGTTDLAVPNFFASSEYFTAYPEDIQLFGASFNTQLPGGASLQGEYSYRIDQPLQVDDNELLGAAQLAGQVALGALAPATANGVGNQVLADLGVDTAPEFAALIGSELSGFREFDVSQTQFTLTQVFDPIEALGIDQWVLVGEIGATYAHDLPDKSVLRFDGPNTPRPGNPIAAAASGVPLQTDGFADDFSWGYRLRARFDMLNAIGPINLSPVIGFSHDVGGTTPLPLSNFVQDRASVSIGLNATYQNSWSAGIQYTNFFAIGDDEFNMIRDRDIVTLNVKYSF